jgi:hypothetical protein
MINEVTVLNLRNFPKDLKLQVDLLVTNERSRIGGDATQSTVCAKLIEIGLKHYKKAK